MKLDICGGNTKLFKDFLNVDGKKTPRTDVVADIRKPLPFENEVAEEIFSCATLEHLIFEQAQRLLNEFYRIMQHGGKLTVAVPDLSKICHAYVDKKLPYSLINQYIYGQLFETSVMEFDCHKSCFDFHVLKAMLEKAGFSEVEEVEYDLPMHKAVLMIKVICKKI